MPILLVKVNTNNVPDSPNKWRAGEIVAAVEDDHVFGSQEVPEAGNFYHITVTDKTLAEVQNYLEEWRHDPTTEQVTANGNNRTIRVTSSLASASGKNAFTQAGVTQLLDDINTDYPGANAQYAAHSPNTFTFTIKAPVSARDELIERVNSAVRNMQYARRRWYVTQAGRDFLANNGGVASGTASQVAGYLRDGLLD